MDHPKFFVWSWTSRVDDICKIDGHGFLKIHLPSLQLSAKRSQATASTPSKSEKNKQLSCFVDDTLLKFTNSSLKSYRAPNRKGSPSQAPLLGYVQLRGWKT